jgi:hypothetical protein
MVGSGRRKFATVLLHSWPTASRNVGACNLTLNIQQLSRCFVMAVRVRTVGKETGGTLLRVYYTVQIEACVKIPRGRYILKFCAQSSTEPSMTSFNVSR